MIGWKYDKVETEEVLLPFTKPEDTPEEVENNWSDFGCVRYEQAKRGSRWQASMLLNVLIDSSGEKWTGKIYLRVTYK